MIQKVLELFLYLIAVKAIFVGSDYSFYYKFKYGIEYERWYSKRPTFNDYLKKKVRK